MSSRARKFSIVGPGDVRVVLLIGEDSLLSPEVGKLAWAQVGGGTALGEEHRGFSSGMSLESRSIRYVMTLTIEISLYVHCVP